MSQLKFALNTSTLFPFKLNVVEQIKVASEGGYDGIELWVQDIEAYLEEGGTITELKKVVKESGITVANAIAFFKWTDKDDQVRAEGLHQAEREMTLLAELGCKSVAAPPTGNVEGMPLKTVATNFVELNKIAQFIGVTPYLEFWGHAANLSTLSEAVYVAMESNVPNAKILLDVFHMYKGRSHFENLSYLNGEQIGIFHVNDYPASSKREVIKDSERVLPGDGVAPTNKIAKYLQEVNYTGYLSLEIFPNSYGKDSTPLVVAKEGLKKMRIAYQL